MSDLNEDIRSAIANMADEAPEPVPFDQITARRTPPRQMWTGPTVAVAVFAAVVVVIGAVAVIRPFGGSTPPLTDLPNLGTDVDGPALENVFTIPEFLPEGFEPVLVNTGWLGDRISLVFRDGSDRELSIATSQPHDPGFAASTSMLANRLNAAYPHLSIAETTVRGRLAFLIDGGDPAAEGWTTAVVVIEGPQLVSRVLAIGVDATDVLRVARSLTALPEDEFRLWASTEISWHLNVGGMVADVDNFVGTIESFDGVNEVTVLPGRRFASDPSLVIQYDDTDQTPTTTMPLDPDTSTTTTLTDPQRVQLLLTLQDPADAEEVAAAAAQIPGTAEITYSPAVEGDIARAFFDAVLGTARVIHDDPVIHQPASGPEPQFDITGLGTEVPLIPATAEGGLPPYAIEGVDELPGPSTTNPLRGPILHIGALEDGTHLILTFDGGSDYFQRTVRDGMWSAGGGTFGTHLFGEVGSGGLSGGPTYVQIRVPLETSVVVLADDNGGRLWQRPIAGHALIPVDTPSSQRPRGTITALAADGTTIGEWRRGG